MKKLHGQLLGKETGMNDTENNSNISEIISKKTSASQARQTRGPAPLALNLIG